MLDLKTCLFRLDYLDEIEKRLKFCNYQLFLKGDSLYQSQKYFEALDFYSLASRELNDNEKQDYHVYLRIACVYCKLERYNDALEANIIAMQYNQGIEQEVLELEQLLQSIIKNTLNKDYQSQQQIKNLEELDNSIVKIMRRLTINSIKFSSAAND